MGVGTHASPPADPPSTPADDRVSIREVARAAAVSMATVSRVLNDTGPVRDATRRRVRAAIAALGYVPHAGARSLITRETRTFGVVLPEIYGEFFSELIRGADLAARPAGYHLLVSGAHSDLDETRDVLRTLHGRVDGLVLMTPAADTAALDDSLPARLPVVLLNDAGARSRHASIRIDNRRGARAMTEHFVGLGHRRIALIQGPPGNQDAAERRVGYHDALAAHGIALDAGLEFPGDFGEEAGHRAAVQIAHVAPVPTAVFAANDSMAIGCLAGLRECRLRVPEDVAIGGFDDIPIARYVTPPLTTIRVPIAELGRRAIARLIDTIQGGAPTGRRRDAVPATLVVRASCGASRRPPPGSPGTPSSPTRGGKRR